MMFHRKLVEIFYNAATSSHRTRTRILLTAVGPLFFFFIVALHIFAALNVDRFLGLPVLLSPPLDVILSVPFVSVGLFLVLWSVRDFLKVKGTPVPFNPPPELVDSGPYAHVRNPMVSGVFLALFGLGVFLGSVSLVFFFTPLFILINVWELKTVEEPELEKRLGEEYIEYKKRVPMFFPGVKRRGRTRTPTGE